MSSKLAKSFEGLSHQQQYKAIIPDYANLQELPFDWQEKDTDDAKAKKNEAAKFAAKMAYEKMRAWYDDDDDSDDSERFSSESEDEYYSHKQSRYPYRESDLKSFFQDLCYNHVFDLGFRVSGFNINDDKNCWCPCSRFTENWRRYFGLTGIAGKNTRASCEKVQKMTPEGLMGHVTTKGVNENCVIHHGIYHYLHKRYGDLWGVVGHKALYKSSDHAKFKLAEAEERKHSNNAKKKLTEEKQKYMRDLLQSQNEKKDAEEHLEKLKKCNRDLGKKLEELKKQKEELGLDDDDFTELFTSFFDNLRAFDNVYESAVENKKKQMCITLTPNFSLQEFFDTNYEAGPKDETFMFRDLDDGRSSRKADDKKQGYHAWRMVHWTVTYIGDVDDVKLSKKKGYKAIDEGGLTRQFLSNVWDQLGDLGVQGPSKKYVMLFERTEAGYIPTPDDLINKELHDRAKSYYRAIGRIMFHSLATKHPICNIAMPEFFRNIIFRDIRPGDKKYRDTDVFNHLSMITSKGSVDITSYLNMSWEEMGYDREGCIAKEDIFSIIIPDFFIDSRTLAIEGLKEGLTLNGKVNTKALFRTMPLRVLTKLAFSKPGITPDDLINVLEPTYSDGSKEIKITQEKCFNETLPNVLRNADELFLVSFVSFATGMGYLPYTGVNNSDSNIKVEFQDALVLDDDGVVDWPRAHTCENTIVFESNGYDCNEETLKKKLDESFKYAEAGGFDMN